MESAVEPRQQGLLVKMLQEATGNNCRSKYMIRMRAEDKEITDSMPENGYSAAQLLNRGSSDSAEPQLPSPGDIRRMFGTDTIDSEPEYTLATDPDWSTVSSTATVSTVNRVRDNEKTNALLRKYRTIEEKRKKIKKYLPISKRNSRPFSEEVKNKNSRAEMNFTKLRKHRGSGCNKNIIPIAPDPIEQQDDQEKNSLSYNATSSRDNGESRITFAPFKINRKSYNTALNVVQSMNSAHWLMIDALYNDMKRENGIRFECLDNLVRKIVQDIYGIDGEFILATVHQDSVQRIVKLGKLMLNIYYEAMFRNNTKPKQKMSVKTQQVNFSQKCIKVYSTFTPHNRQSSLSKMYNNLIITSSENKQPRCEACFLKNKEKEKNKKSKNSKIPENRNNFKSKLRNEMSRNKSNKPEIEKNNNKTTQELKITKNSKVNATVKTVTYDKEGVPVPTNYSNTQIFSDEFLQDVSDIVTFDNRDNTDSVASEELDKEWESENSSVSYVKEKSSVSQGQTIKTISEGDTINNIDQVELRAKNGPFEGHQHLLSSYYNDNSAQEDRFFMTTENVITLNNQLEKTLLKELDNSKIVQEKDYNESPNSHLSPDYDNTHQEDRFSMTTENVNSLNNQLVKTLMKGKDTPKIVEENHDNETYHECEILTMAKNKPGDCHPDGYEKWKTEVQNCPRQPRWMRLTKDCTFYKSNVSAFLSLMLGLTTAFFWRGSFINQPSENRPLKDSVKQVIKTFLLGVLRLLDDL